jgi:glyoxylase-like metal-dependent hydrolase (beta-lactamase superfamily II)
MTSIPFTAGLHQLDSHVWAWLHPDGGWGRSNAGLIGCQDLTLLVDTQFDLAHTAAMLAAMRPITEAAPIRHAVNTHGNGDHCYGNELLASDVTIWAAPEASAHLRAESPALLAGMLAADLPAPLGEYLQASFGAFEFAGITPRMPDQAITADHDLDLGARPVRLLRAGPAHTHGDVAVHDVNSGVVFTGDLLFIGGTPIMWAGPAESWIATLDRLLALDADTFVPGHGPVTDAAGVCAVREYLGYIGARTRQLYASGRSAAEAARRIDLGPFADLGNPERIVINVDTIYRHLDPEHPPPDLPALFAAMAGWAHS